MSLGSSFLPIPGKRHSNVGQRSEAGTCTQHGDVTTDTQHRQCNDSQARMSVWEWGEGRVRRRAGWVGQLRTRARLPTTGISYPLGTHRRWRGDLVQFFLLFFFFSHSIFEFEDKGHRESRGGKQPVLQCQAIHSICTWKLSASISLRFWQEVARPGFGNSEGCKTLSLSLSVSRGSCLPMTFPSPQEGHRSKHLPPLVLQMSLLQSPYLHP